MNARATLDGEVARVYVNDGDTVAKGDALIQIRKEIPGETRQVTDEDGNVTMETGKPTFKYETSPPPGDGKVSTSVLVGQQFAIGDTVASVAPLHVLGRRRPERRPDVPPPGGTLHRDRHH